jgi:hypothetical protein
MRRRGLIHGDGEWSQNDDASVPNSEAKLIATPRRTPPLATTPVSLPSRTGVTALAMVRRRWPSFPAVAGQENITPPPCARR